jgi:hypothetical protein
MKEEPRIMGQEVVEALNEKAKPETMPALLPLGTKRKIILE